MVTVLGGPSESIRGFNVAITASPHACVPLVSVEGCFRPGASSATPIVSFPPIVYTLSNPPTSMPPVPLTSTPSFLAPPAPEAQPEDPDI